MWHIFLCACLKASTEAVSLLTQNYRNKALDTFIRGLNGNLSQLLAVREPVDLPQALNLCTKLRNQNFRSFHVNNAFKSNQRAPDLPPRKSGNIPQQQQQQQQQPYGQQVFYPQLAYLPQHSNQWSQARNQHTGRYGNGEPQRLHQPFARPPMVPQRQQNPVEPMEVDQSMQTRRVDYMNRPNYNGFRGKRPASSYNVGPGKQQRTFHLNNDLQEVSEDNNNNYTRNTTTVNSNEMLNMEEEEINYDNYEQNFADVHHLKLTDSSLPYFEIKTNNDRVLKILVDTGSNENYIKADIVENPITNKHKFSVSSIGGKVEVNKFKLLNLFNFKEKLKFFLLPTLKSFHAILGNNSLKKLNAVIFTKDNYMLINGNTKVPLNQHKFQSFHQIEISHNTLDTEQKIMLQNLGLCTNSSSKRFDVELIVILSLRLAS